MVAINRSPVARFSLAGDPWEDVLAHKLVVQRDQGQHDRVQLTMSSSEMTSVEGLKEKTISFTFGRPPYSEMFYGYIAEANPVESSNGRFQFTLQVYGASLLMLRSTTPRFFRDRTTPSLMEELAAECGMGFFGPTDDFVISSIAQTAETNWEMVLDLAQSFGLTVFPVQGVLVCMDAAQYFFEEGAQFRLTKNTIDPGDSAIMLESFESTESTVLSRSQGLSVSFFSPTSGQVQTVNQEGYERHTHVPGRFRSHIEAEKYLSVADQVIDRWVSVAEAVIQGQAQVRPGTNVEVEMNTSYYNPSNGRWFVVAVEHQMENSEFKTKLSLARPRDYRTVRAVEYEPFWLKASKSRPSMSHVTDITDVGEWRSSWAPYSVSKVA